MWIEQCDAGAFDIIGVDGDGNEWTPMTGGLRYSRGMYPGDWVMRFTTWSIELGAGTPQFRPEGLVVAILDVVDGKFCFQQYTILWFR